MAQNMYWISDAVYALILALIWGNDRKFNIDGHSGKSYIQLILWSIFFCLQDMVWGLCYAGVISNDIIFMISSSVFHLSAMATTFFWLKYAWDFLDGHEGERKLLFILNGVLFLFELAALIRNIFIPTVFTIRNGVYATAYMRPATFFNQFVIYSLIAILTLVHACRVSGEERKKSFTMFQFTLVPILLGTLQLLYTDSPFYSMAIFIGCFIIHTFIAADEHNKAEEDKKREYRIVAALSASYLNVYIINTEAETVEILKLNGYITTGLAKEKRGPYPYEQTCQAYISGRVYTEDIPTVTENMRLPHLLAALKDTGEYEFSYRVLENGEIHYYQGKYVAAEDGYIVCGFQNIDVMIAAERERNAELETAKETAEAASAAKTSFLFNMSHDIRTPMNAIMGFRDLLEKHQDDPVKRQDYLLKIKDASTVLLSIINNVLEMARIEKGTLEITETAWTAEAFNDTIYSFFHEMMAEKGLDFTRQINVQHHYVYCDQTKLREIFINILSNAYKYTNAGGKVNMYLEEIPSDRDGWVLYRTTVSDTGIGMSEAFLPHIFEEFSREQNTTDAKVEGTGLGMPIVKRLVEMLDGTIEVRSKKGEGSAFIVTIPHRIAPETDPAEHAETGMSTEQFKNRHILLAEDNDLNAEIAMEILHEAGFIVDRAEDGVVCMNMLKKADAGYYGVILMDIQMPNMNGYEATKAIRNLEDPDKKQIPIIAMTANAFEEDRREALNAGMNGHLAKPIEIPKLMETLAEILN